MNTIGKFQKELLFQNLCTALSTTETAMAYIGTYLSGEFLFVNSTLEKFLGQPKDKLLSNGISAISTLTVPEDLIGIRQVLAKGISELQSGKIRRSDPTLFKFRLFDKSGRLRFYRQAAFSLTFTEEGKLEFALGILIEETEEAYSKVVLWEEFLLKEKILSEVWEILIQNESSLRPAMVASSKKDICELTLYTNPQHNLTKREKEILQHISDGLSSKEVSDCLNISFHPVEAHRKNLLVKFNAKNSAELIKNACKHYWLE